jgi:DNA repair photolyase
MGLNISNGNMYDWVTHTWNVLKGQCYHNCSYCYMKRWGKQKSLRFDDKELQTDLGEGNTIFVGSSCDMFAIDISDTEINDILEHCKKFNHNKYLFQTKNPLRACCCDLPVFSIICTTIETNRWYPEIMGNSPEPKDRAE